MNIKSLVALSFAGLSGFAFCQDFQVWRNQPMPDFIMTTTTGKRITTKSLRGKVVLFDFWATWCAPCKAASPSMQKLANKFAKKGLVVIGADVNEQGPGSDGPGPAIGYSKSHHYKYMFTYNNNGLYNTFKFEGIPAFILVDRKGVIRDIQMGLPSMQTSELYPRFESMVEKVLDRKS